MKKIILFLAFIFIYSNCSPKSNSNYLYESETMKIKPIKENIFLHISYLQTTNFGKVACNGMVYFNNDEAIVFDTPIDDSSSAELIHWIQVKQKKKIKAIVATHFHEDCLGGLKAFHNSGIKSYSNKRTIEILDSINQDMLPEFGFENETIINIGNDSVYVKFYGEGHTEDNIVGFIPAENTLFGGCLIKSLKASKGFLGDANTSEWSKTVEQIKEELPDLEIVIPGHGKVGGIDLLDYTIQLFEE